MKMSVQVLIFSLIFIIFSTDAVWARGRSSGGTRSYSSRSYSPRSTRTSTSRSSKKSSRMSKSSKSATRVSGYRTKKGKTVKSYYRSTADASKKNNWSTKGNINPRTGKRGYKNP